MVKGLFISIEGGDGSGKSTQINLLKNYFETKGYEVVITREPGGTVISEDIRRVILNTEYMEMSDITEALLYAASRAQHVHEVIIPNLNEGKIVICDRYVDSSIVYQGYGRALGMDLIEDINSYAIQGVMPALTILLDLTAEEGLKRKKSQQDLDRLELQKEAFHRKVIEGYKILANKHKERILAIDATQSINIIHQQIIDKIKTLL